MSLYNVLIKFLGVDAVSPQIKKITSSMETLQKRLAKGSSHIKDFSRAMLKISAVLGGVGIYALKNADDFEIMENQLRATTGSLVEAKQIMESITKFSLKEPFAFEEVSGAAKALSAARVPIKEINKYLDMLGNISAGSGQKLELLTEQLLKMKAGQRQYTILTQMERAGIPLKTELYKLAKLHGYSEQAFDKAAKKGKISFALILEGYAELEKRYAGAMERQAATIEGSMKRAHNMLRVFAKDLGDSLAEVYGIKEGLKGALDIVAEFEPIFKKFLNTNPEMVKLISNSVIFLGVLGLIGYACWYIERGIVGIKIAFLALRGLALVILANPLVFAAIAVYALTEAFEKLSDLIKGGGLDWSGIAEGIGNMFKHPEAMSFGAFFPNKQGEASINKDVATTNTTQQKVGVDITLKGLVNAISALTTTGAANTSVTSNGSNNAPI
jgi:hypothetical protein